jgi:hypothetical protein
VCDLLIVICCLVLLVESLLRADRYDGKERAIRSVDMASLSGDSELSTGSDVVRIAT